MHTILDLDLDFFVWPPFRRRPEEARLPRSAWRRLASEVEVRLFLENRCNLSSRAPVSGSEAEEHQDAFRFWRQWIDDGRIIAPFKVVHVDAHSDLGSGMNRSPIFIETELLAKSIKERTHPAFGSDQLNSGNYLLGAIAARWISELVYVYPADPTEVEPLEQGGLQRFEDEVREIARLLATNQGPSVSDLPAWIFRNGDWKTHLIELKHYHPSPSHRSYADYAPVHIEPPVPFHWIEEHEFTSAGITHMFLARSPQYTPAEADKLLAVIREYFSEA